MEYFAPLAYLRTHYVQKASKLYNSERPHMSISNFTPDKVYHAKEPVQVKRLWKNYYPNKKKLCLPDKQV